MNPKCRAALNQTRQAAGGRPLTDAQAQAIEDRIKATAKRLAYSDQQWRTYSADQRTLKAAEVAMDDIKAEAQRKVDNAQRQVLKTAETEQRIADLMGAQKKWERDRALVEEMQKTHAYIDGVKRDNLRKLFSLIDAASSKQGVGARRRALMALFDAENPAMTRDLALEVFSKGNGGTGNKLAAQAAKAWLEVTDAMRQSFNNAGGEVRQLDYGYLPQAHDALRVLAKGQDAWANEMLPMLDRRRYLREDGSSMNDAEVLDLLRGAWETISTDGANKRQPGQFRGNGARANRGSQGREIHFKDGQTYLEYLSKYGTGSMYDAMLGHVGGLARDIGLVERYGPNPESQMRVQFDMAKRNRGLGGQIAELFAGPEATWAVLSGASAVPKYAQVAGVMRHARNIETFGKLQSAVLSSITDLGTYAVTVGYNRLPYFSSLANITKAGGKDTKAFMNAHGFMAESIISDMNRLAGETIAQNWSGRIANATMRLSLMNAWTETLRRGFQMSMMQGMGRMRSKAWGQLTEWDRYHLTRKGLTADDWSVIQAAQPLTWRGSEFVTPDAIYATKDPRAGEVVAKFIGAITDESEIAVLNPDLTTRAITTGGGMQAGTAGGELARSMAQFKSFPIAMLSRHWRRILDTPELDGRPMAANRLAYAGALLGLSTALGAIAFQSKQVVSGKDPVDMTTAKFWSRAFVQGGGIGFMGDMLLNDPADGAYGGPFQTGLGMGGPLGGSVGQAMDLTITNTHELNQGKNTHAGAEAMRFVRSHAPLVNLWYAKAALDHAGLQAMQEAASPGYLSRIKNKARKDWRQEYWWEPGTGTPDRAPDLAAVAGD
ncbi:MAG: hypothetical protein KA191_18025 [Verrucomicrobia bacterium]|nr:hypothetical protein [Verrucomicrobiota bacterium]